MSEFADDMANNAGALAVPRRVIDFPAQGVFRIPLILQEVVDVERQLVRCTSYNGTDYIVIMPSYFDNQMQLHTHIEAVVDFREENGAAIYDCYVSNPIGTPNVAAVKKAIEATWDPRFQFFFNQFYESDQGNGHAQV